MRPLRLLRRQAPSFPPLVLDIWDSGLYYLAGGQNEVVGIGGIAVQ